MRGSTATWIICRTRYEDPVKITQVILQLAATCLYTNIYKDDRSQVTDACAGIICENIHTQALMHMKVHVYNQGGIYKLGLGT